MYKLTTFFVIVSFALLAAGCPSSSSSENNQPSPPDDGNPSGESYTVTGSYERDYWGEWICGSNGASWYIAYGGIVIDRDVPQGAVTLSKQSERVIEVTEGSKKYYLYASRIPNASFTGKIVKEMGAALAASDTGFAPAANIPVKITNIRNPALFGIVRTNAAGEYALEETIIPDDKYKIEPEGGTAEEVYIGNDGEDIGTITITKGVNFKTRVLPWQEEYGEHLFVNNNYTFTIEVENTGTEDCLASTYALSWPENLTVTTSQTSGTWGTIKSGMKKTLTLSVMCREIQDAQALRTIGITITDSINRKTWTDSVSFVFKRGVFNLNIAAKKEVSGVIISPKGAAQSFRNVKNTTVILPWYEEDFLIFFSGAKIDMETYYSFGVGRAALDYSSRADMQSVSAGGNLDPGIYEPNNTETAARSVDTDNAIEAFLHENDIDYYKFNPSSVPPYRPNTRIVNWNLLVDGADGTATTTKLILDLSLDMGSAFTADNITLSPALTRGAFLNKGNGRYELPISGDWANNTNVTVTLVSPMETTLASLEKTIALNRATTEFRRVTADGADGTAPTTKLTLEFSVDMGASFTANNITLSNPAITKGTLVSKGRGKYELPISGAWTNNTSVTVTVTAPESWAMIGDTEKTAAVYWGTTNWSSVTADGANSTANTTKLTLNFSVDMGAAFTAANITLSPTLTKGTLVSKGAGKYELPISGTWNNNTSVTVTLTAPTGWTISGGSQKTAAVYKATTQWSTVTADGTNGTVATTKLTLNFSVDMGTAFTAANITLSPTTLTKGTLVSKGSGNYELPISGTWANNTSVTVSITAPTGWTLTGSVSKTVAVYTPVQWNSLTADGTNGTANTTKLTLDFNTDMGSSFTASNITLSPALTKGTLSAKGSGRYELPISGTWANNTSVTVTITPPSGWTMTGVTQKTVTVYRATTQFNNLTADGTNSTATTTKLTLDFGFDMGSSFTASNITLSPALTKGTLSAKGSGRYELPVSGSWNNSTSVTVTINAPSGWTLSGSAQKTVTIYRATTQWNSVTADGADGTALTTKLTFNFSVNMGSAFTASNITLSPALTKGALVSKGSGNYELPISGTWTNNTSVTVTITAPSGWTMTGDTQKTAAVYKRSGLLKGATLGTAVFVGNKNLAQSLAYITQNAVENDNYFVLLDADESISPQTLSYSGKKVGITLLGNDTARTVQLSANGSFFSIGNGTTLTLDNNIILTGRNNNSSRLVSVGSGGTFVMNDGTTITRNVGGGGVYVWDGVFTMNGGTISGNGVTSSGSSGGGVLVGSGTFTMNGGVISGNYGRNEHGHTFSGGGVAVGGGTFIMHNGTISGNGIDNREFYGGGGGGVYVFGSETSFTMSGGTISGNSSSRDRSSGGGVYVYNGTFTMSGGTISGNHASGYGGGVYVYSGTFTKSNTGGIIYGNNASPASLQNTTGFASYGGAVCVYISSSNKPRNTTITANQAFSSESGPWD